MHESRAVAPDRPVSEPSLRSSPSWSARRGTEVALTRAEVVVSLLLAALLSLGLLYMAAGRKRTVAAQTRTTVLRETLRDTMDFLARQVRLAGRGWGGCPRGEVMDGPTVALRSLQIFNACELSHDAPAACPLATARSDSFVITARDTREGPPLRIAQRAIGTPMDVVITSPAGFRVNDWIVLRAPGGADKDCVLRRVSSRPLSLAAGVGLWRFSTASPAGHADPPAWTYPRGSLVVHITADPTTDAAVRAYDPPSTLIPRYFSVDRSKGHPRLISWQTLDAETPQSALAKGYQVVAEGIEDLQLAWACDVDDDDVLREGSDDKTRAADEWAFNVAGDRPPDCGWRTPRAVRITLIARARKANPRYQRGHRPAAEDRPPGTVRADRARGDNGGTFIRRVLTVTVRPENLRQVRRK